MPSEGSPTKFQAEKWTDVISSASRFEQWAVIMLDGEDAGSPCAFGSEKLMHEYAADLNEKKGVIA